MVDEAVRNRIVGMAHQLFVSRGYRPVTMQNIAEELGMSKKTIYLYFQSKDEIAQAVIENAYQLISNHVDLAVAADANPLDLLRDAFMKIREETLRLSPLFLNDIQKTLPHLWEHIVSIRSEKVKFVAQLLHKAKERGYIRPSLDPRMVTVLFAETVQAVIRPDVWSKHGISLDDMWDTLFSVFLYGITNEEEQQ